MTTIYAAPKLVYVSSDGEGGHVLKIQPPTGELLVLPLDLKTATCLTAEFAKVARRLAHPE